MHRLLALALVIGCGSSGAPAPVQPAQPVPVEVASAGSGDDPCDGGEVASADPCDGGEVQDKAKDQVAIADPTGDEMEGGLGLVGTGTGGGGTGSGAGLGSIGTIGSGAGQGTGQGYGGSGPRGRATVPTVTLGTPTVTGTLDRDVIRRVIRQRINQIRYCYEKLLAQNPAAGGVLRLELVITAEGSVAQAKGTGVAPDLEACVTKRAMGWTFPKPKAGIVKVEYPITFARPSGT